MVKGLGFRISGLPLPPPVLGALARGAHPTTCAHPHRRTHPVRTAAEQR